MGGKLGSTAHHETAASIVREIRSSERVIEPPGKVVPGCVAGLRQSGMVVAGMEGGKVGAWHVEDGRPLRLPWELPGGAVSCVAEAAEGTHVLAGGRRCIYRILLAPRTALPAFADRSVDPFIETHPVTPDPSTVTVAVPPSLTDVSSPAPGGSELPSRLLPVSDRYVWVVFPPDAFVYDFTEKRVVTVLRGGVPKPDMPLCTVQDGAAVAVGAGKAKILCFAPSGAGGVEAVHRVASLSGDITALAAAGSVAYYACGRHVGKLNLLCNRVTFRWKLADPVCGLEEESGVLAAASRSSPALTFLDARGGRLLGRHTLSFSPISPTSLSFPAPGLLLTLDGALRLHSVPSFLTPSYPWLASYLGPFSGSPGPAPLKAHIMAAGPGSRGVVGSPPPPLPPPPSPPPIPVVPPPAPAAPTVVMLRVPRKKQDEEGKKAKRKKKKKSGDFDAF